jgi:hypothetical protein
MGNTSGVNNTLGSMNVFIGTSAGRSNTIGDNIVYLGRFAGRNNTVGESNIFIGYRAGYNEMGSNKLYITNNETDSSQTLIYGNFEKPELHFNAAVGIDTCPIAPHVLTVAGSAFSTEGWLTLSDKKIKTNIRNIEDPLSLMQKINGVSFSWKNRNQHKKHYGVIAQEIEKILPSLVQTNEHGEKSVNFSEFIPILIEAFKEQQKQIQNLEQQLKYLEKNP